MQIECNSNWAGSRAASGNKTAKFTIKICFQSWLALIYVIQGLQFSGPALKKHSYSEAVIEALSAENVSRKQLW